MGFGGLDRGAPIVCFKAVGANGPSKGLSRELGIEGAAVWSVCGRKIPGEVIGTLRADMISHHRDRNLDIAV